MNREEIDKVVEIIRALVDASGHTEKCWKEAGWTAYIPECGAVEKMKIACLDANRYLRENDRFNK